MWREQYDSLISIDRIARQTTRLTSEAGELINGAPIKSDLLLPYRLPKEVRHEENPGPRDFGLCSSGVVHKSAVSCEQETKCQSGQLGADDFQVGDGQRASRHGFEDLGVGSSRPEGALGRA